MKGKRRKQNPQKSESTYRNNNNKEPSNCCFGL